MDYQIRRIFDNSQKNKVWLDLLTRYDLKPEKTLDYTIGLYDGEQLIATGSLYQNIIKCIAIDETYQGGAVFNSLISHLINEIYSRGYVSIYVYTKYELLTAFEFLGFKEIASVKPVMVFMEKAIHGFAEFLLKIQQESPINTTNSIAGIVMNANPFTRGHLHLIETAAKENALVHVFVLSEDASDFPATVRKQLVIEGTKQFKNVCIHDTGDYLVSSKTFPAYFIHDDEETTRIQAHLDATIFLKIAETLGITKRYVGEEAYSVATNIYNEEMQKVYQGKLELIIIPRLAVASDNIVSATKVRLALKEDRLEDVKNFVPQTTYDFLLTYEGEKVINKIKNRK